VSRYTKAPETSQGQCASFGALALTRFTKAPETSQGQCAERGASTKRGGRWFRNRRNEISARGVGLKCVKKQYDGNFGQGSVSKMR
jgi:hypothetical protein